MASIPLNEVVYFDAITHSPITGAVADADSAPTFEVFEEATDTDIGVGGSMTKRTDKIGNYRGTFTVSEANGFEVGKYYSIVVSATVGEVAGKCVASSFRLTAAETTAGKIPATLGSTDYAGNTPQTGDAYSPAQYALTAATAAKTAAEAVETIVKPDGPGDLAAIKTQTDKLSFTGTDVKATLDGEEVTPTTASKTGYALTSEERTAIAAAIEADLIDDETHQAVMAAILAKLEAGFPDLDTLTLTAIASQVRTELATELARIDATISSRHAAGAAVAKSPATLNWSADVSNKPTIGDATAANQTTMLNRIGTFTGTGINTIFGFFKALMSKAADTPTDIGGTFSPATDSVEAIRDTPPIGTEMRGTDGANTVTPPTVEAVAAQLERDGGPLLVTAETVVENLDAKVSLAGSPAGEGSVDLTITCSAGGVPQDGVAVWLYLDDQYSQIAHGPLYSNAHGTVVFHVDPPAPYYAKLQRGGLNFPNQTLVWNEDEQRYETE